MIKIIKNKIIIFFYSFISVTGLIHFLSTMGNYERIYTNNFIFFILFVLYFIFLNKIKIKIDKRDGLFSIIFSIILSLILMIGSCMETNANISSKVVFIVGLIGLILFLFPLICLLLKSNIKINEGRKVNPWIIFLIIWLFGILAWLALYPGGYDYDAPVQLAQFMNPNYSVNTHFSVLFSYLEYVIISFGYNVFGNYQAAIGLFTFLQMTIVSLVTTYICIFIGKNTKQNRLILYLTVIFFSLFPFHLLLQVSCVQDTFFSCCIAIFAINLYKIIKDDKFFIKKTNWLSLILSGLLACMFRNNGIYIILITLVLTILLKIIFKIKINLKRIIISFLIIIVLYYFYFLILLPSLGVKKGNSLQEMSSIPSQQLARVYNKNISAFSEKELNELNKFYPNCDFTTYNTYESISDGIKACLDEDYTKQNKFDYLKLYISIGVKDPINYGKAFLLNTYGFWYPNKSYPDERIYHPYIEYKVSTPSIFSSDLIEIKRNSKLPIYKKVLNYILDQNNWQKIPIISSICSMGTYFILIIFIFISCIYKKKYKYLLVLSLFIGIYATLFLSPVALYRYVYPIVLSIPLLILILLNLYKKDKNS